MPNPEKIIHAQEEYHSAIVDYHSLEILKREAELRVKAGQDPIDAFRTSASVLKERIRLAEQPLKSSIQMVRGHELPTVIDRELPE